MSRIHRLGRSLAVASVALILVAGASFAHDAVLNAPASPISPPSTLDIDDGERDSVVEQETDNDANEQEAPGDRHEDAVVAEPEVEDAVVAEPEVEDAVVAEPEVEDAADEANDDADGADDNDADGADDNDADTTDDADDADKNHADDADQDDSDHGADEAHDADDGEGGDDD